MALVGVLTNFGDRQFFTGVAGVSDNDIVIETEDISRYNQFTLVNGAGAVDVFVSIDGVAFLTTPLAMIDKGLALAGQRDYVIVTVADRVFAFEGIYRKLRVRQAGVTAATGSLLLMTRIGT